MDQWGLPVSDLLSRCLDAAMPYYPKGTTYCVLPGQSWDAAAYASRRLSIEPLVSAVIELVQAQASA